MTRPTMLLALAALLATALPSFGATIAEELAAAQTAIKAFDFAAATPNCAAALQAYAASPAPTADEMIAAAQASRLLTACLYDAAIETGTLTPEQMTEARKARREIAGVQAMKIIAHGEQIDLAKELVPGKTCIVDFYSIYCGPCMSFAPYLESLVDARDDLYLIKVDINRPDKKGIDWSSPTAQQFSLKSIPHLKIYGPDGKLQTEGDEARKKAIEMIEALPE
jgi:thiol-disulfide isomerase/thioredoxin